MALSNAQFSKLNAMGIQVWQQRKLNKTTETVDQCLDISIEDYQKSQLVNDVLNWLQIAKAQVTITPKGLDCGDFYWRFHDKEQCQYWPEKALLVSPPLQQLFTNESIKKQLWLQLQQISNEH